MPVRLRPEIAALPPYRQGKPAAADAFKLSSNENPFPPHPAVLAALTEPAPHRYPDASAAALRERLAERAHCAIDEVHVGAGSVAILYQLVSAVAAPGDEVVYAWRSFEAYPGIVTVSGATSVRVPLDASARHDLNAMAEAITPRTRAILLCTPNNPTGPVLTRAEVEAFLARVPADVLVILDEAYREFVTDPEAVDGLDLLAKHDNLVVTRTFSKAFGLAGVRIGYAYGSADVLAAAATTGIPLSVTGIAQRAALAALDHEAEYQAHIAQLVARREAVVAGLRELGAEVPQAQGNFVWFATGNDDALEKALERHGIVARVFPGDGVRVSIGEEASVAALLRAVAEVVDSGSLTSESLA